MDQSPNQGDRAGHLAAIWRPAGKLEEQLLAARQSGDQPAFLLALARARLLLPALVEPAPERWVVSTMAGRIYVLAFTSPAAMVAAGLDESGTSLRATGPGELAARWPAADVFLAVDPGLPIEAYLDSGTVRDLADLAAHPATAAEARLLRALDTGDLAAYLQVLMPTEVYLPLAGDPGDTGPRDAGFPWLRLAVGDVIRLGGDDEAPLVVFTSRERLADAVGPRPWLHLPFARLVDVWPDGTPLAVDPGLEHGARLDALLVRRLRDTLRTGPRPS